MWLAFHDDLADAKNADPVLRESTRLKCAYVIAAQCSYEPAFIKANIPGNAWQADALLKLFDVKPEEVLNPPAEKTKLMKACAPIELVKAGSPPVYLYYGQDRSVPEGKDPGLTIHHPKFGDVLKEKMDGLKIQCIVKVKGEALENPTPMEFLRKHLQEDGK